MKDHNESKRGVFDNVPTFSGRVDKGNLIRQIIREEGGKEADCSKVMLIAQKRIDQLPKTLHQKVRKADVYQMKFKMGLGKRTSKQNGKNSYTESPAKIQFPKSTHLESHKFFTALELEDAKVFIESVGGDHEKAVELIELVASLRE